jgi:iron complex transport system ATP-binding protein
VLELQNLCCGYGAGDILKGINLKVNTGEFLCLAGPNGCGKSTLLKAIARLLPFRGIIALNSRETRKFTRKELAQHIALLPQASSLYFPYTVYDTVIMGRYAYSNNWFNSPGAADISAVEEALTALDLNALREKFINELSGGQLQRVFLAQALAQNPRIILLDEPTSHLDLKYQIKLLDHLAAWVKSGDRIIIAVFHDLNLALRYGSTAVLMTEGTIAAYNSAAAVFTSPALSEVYGMDVSRFMQESLGKWQCNTS